MSEQGEYESVSYAETRLQKEQAQLESSLSEMSGEFAELLLAYGESACRVNKGCLGVSTWHFADTEEVHLDLARAKASMEVDASTLNDFVAAAKYRVAQAKWRVYLAADDVEIIRRGRGKQERADND